MILLFIQCMPNEDIMVETIAKIKKSGLLCIIVSSSKNTVPCIR
ncbi:hypothetical protein AC094_28230 [Bacteroides fragilis]|uniref:Uncharacterized protein n=1 Tax=Bacteroides fragilis TaxID=817 RepID=A0A853PQU7_BACFG|nr:hypothetical protein M075_3067 [Bacteroides fragilis str. 20793-3]OCR30689.1 hypothetical protein AC094_28230 [Bacteroides fragilis]